MGPDQRRPALGDPRQTLTDRPVIARSDAAIRSPIRKKNGSPRRRIHRLGMTKDGRDSVIAPFSPSRALRGGVFALFCPFFRTSPPLYSVSDTEKRPRAERGTPEVKIMKKGLFKNVRVRRFMEAVGVLLVLVTVSCAEGLADLVLM